MSVWGVYKSNAITINGLNATWTWSPVLPPTPEPEPEPQEEDEMAQRHNFTFTYTGAEVADAVVKVIAELTEERDQAVTLTEQVESLRAQGIGIDEDGAIADVDDLNASILAWETEERTYRRNAEKDFELDQEDVDYYGL